MFYLQRCIVIKHLQVFTWHLNIGNNIQNKSKYLQGMYYKNIMATLGIAKNV